MLGNILERMGVFFPEFHATLVFRTLSEICTLVFFALSTVMYAVRYVPQRSAPGFFPRFAAMAGTFLSLGFVLLPAPELSSALYLVSLLFLIGGAGFAISALLVLGQPPAGGPAARNHGALCARPPFALSWGETAAVGGMVAIF